MQLVKLEYAQWGLARYQQLGRVKTFAHNRSGYRDSVALEAFWHQIPSGMEAETLCKKIKFSSPVGF